MADHGDGERPLLSAVFPDAYVRRDPADIQAAVLRAGVDLLEGEGLVGGLPLLTPARLARVAHCGVASVYRHWATKGDLAAAVLRHVIDLRSGDYSTTIGRAVMESIERGEPLGAMVARASEASVQACNRFDALVGELVAAGPYLPDEMAQPLRRRLCQSRDNLASVVAVLPELYDLERRTPDAPVRVADMICSFARGVLTDQWATHGTTVFFHDREILADAAERLTIATLAAIGCYYRVASDVDDTHLTARIAAAAPKPSGP
jgi:AcrR family transcriptional regulator